jgi:hypothetical protein
VAPRGALSFNLTPIADVEIAVAVGRARHVHDSAMPMVDGLYGDFEGSSNARAIYPLHPAAATVLRSLYPGDVRVGTLAKAAREVIEPWHGERDFQRLIMPAALMRSAAVHQALNAQLGVAGRAARKIANAAAAGNGNYNMAAATLQMLVDTLVLLQVSGVAAPVSVSEILANMDLADLNDADAAGLTRALMTLAKRSQGAIVYDPVARLARFEPRGAGSLDLAAFNSALALVRSFDPDDQGGYGAGSGSQAQPPEGGARCGARKCIPQPRGAHGRVAR